MFLIYLLESVFFFFCYSTSNASTLPTSNLGSILLPTLTTQCSATVTTNCLPKNNLSTSQAVAVEFGKLGPTQENITNFINELDKSNQNLLAQCTSDTQISTKFILKSTDTCDLNMILVTTPELAKAKLFTILRAQYYLMGIGIKAYQLESSHQSNQNKIQNEVMKFANQTNIIHNTLLLNWGVNYPQIDSNTLTAVQNSIQSAGIASGSMNFSDLQQAIYFIPLNFSKIDNYVQTVKNAGQTVAGRDEVVTAKNAADDAKNTANLAAQAEADAKANLDTAQSNLNAAKGKLADAHSNLKNKITSADDSSDTLTATIVAIGAGSLSTFPTIFNNWQTWRSVNSFLSTANAADAKRFIAAMRNSTSADPATEAELQLLQPKEDQALADIDNVTTADAEVTQAQTEVNDAETVYEDAQSVASDDESAYETADEYASEDESTYETELTQQTETEYAAEAVQSGGDGAIAEGGEAAENAIAQGAAESTGEVVLGIAEDLALIFIV